MPRTTSAGRPRAGRLGAKSQQTRSRLLDATARVLSREGYANTRLAAIAAGAGVETTAVYYYFESRDALVEAVLLEGVDRALAAVSATIEASTGGTSPLDRICLAVGAHLRVVLGDSDYALAAIRNAGQLPEPLRARLLARQRSYGAVWSRLFDEGKASGEIDPGLSSYAAQMLVIGALNWAPEWWDARRLSLGDVIATAEQLVRRGLAPGPVATPR